MSFKFRTSPKERAGNRFIYQVLREIASAAIQEKKRSGLTQREIANRLEVDKSQVSRILKGEANLTLRTVGEFLWALGWEPEFRAHPRKIAAGNHIPTTSTTKAGQFYVTDSDRAASTTATLKDASFEARP